jgi:hypothetical protein
VQWGCGFFHGFKSFLGIIPRGCEWWWCGNTTPPPRMWMWSGVEWSGVYPPPRILFRARVYFFVAFLLSCVDFQESSLRRMKFFFLLSRDPYYVRVLYSASQFS